MRLSKAGVAATGAFVFASLLALGCGAGDSSTVTESQTTTVFLPSEGSSPGGTAGETGGGSGGTAGNAIEIQMGEFFFKPTDATAAAGSVKISAPNVGATTHELVLVRTDLDPANLPTLANGEVDEEALESPGEIPDVAAGSTATTTVDLKPGKYAVICNLPGHYGQGMYGSLTVSGG
jgi:uncharacterized cupredoxin-like copper-binding protein